MHGLTHPITGSGHVLAMVAVGVLAAQLGDRALWLVPLSFLGVMAGAGALGMAGIQLPFAEVGIAVIVLGLTVTFRLKLPELAGNAWRPPWAALSKCPAVRCVVRSHERLASLHFG